MIYARVDIIHREVIECRSEEIIGVPGFLCFLSTRSLSNHATLVGVGVRQIVHIRHLTDLSHWGSADEALLLTSCARIVLLVLGILVLPLGFLFTVKHGEALLELVKLHTELATDGDKTTEAIDVVLVLLINFLVHLERLIEQVHASVAAGDHELPFDLLGLDLRRTFEVLDSLFKHILLGMVHAEARDYIDLRWIVPVALLVEVDSLELILLLLVEVAHLGQDFRVTGHLCDQDVVPF